MSESSAEGLFEIDQPPIQPPAPKPDMSLSAGRRLTLRQAADIAAGRHPLRHMLALHPEAPRDATRDDRNRPFTCGTCVHRFVSGWGYPHCDKAYGGHSQASECRGWWPACSAYEAR